MNLIVFTPATTKSAIGRMAAMVTRALMAQGCEVTVVRTEAKHLLSTEAHDFGARVLTWDDEAEVGALIRHADAGIYQIGNNFDFHAGAIHWISAFPGLVCLHDFFLGHLFYGWAQAHRAQAGTVLQRWYGDEMAERFFCFPDGSSFIEGTRELMPMTEWICSQADGVITHSQWGVDRILNSCPGPIRVVPLAYDAPAGMVSTKADLNIAVDDQALHILTIGHVNPNKRVESVIQAIGRSPLLKKRVTYRLVGAVQPEMKDSLSTLADRLGVNLMISGEVDEATLAQAIIASDVISCLRWPALEAASASAIEAMLYGKVVIVTDTGFYTEIPDSCAIKITLENEIDELQSTLEALIQNKIDAKKMKTEAQLWASKTFTAENYSNMLIGTVSQTFLTAPAIRAIGNLSRLLHQWSSLDDLSLTEEFIQPLHIFEMNGKGNISSNHQYNEAR